MPHSASDQLRLQSHLASLKTSLLLRNEMPKACASVIGSYSGQASAMLCSTTSPLGMANPLPLPVMGASSFFSGSSRGRRFCLMLGNMHCPSSHLWELRLTTLP